MTRGPAGSPANASKEGPGWSLMAPPGTLDLPGMQVKEAGARQLSHGVLWTKQKFLITCSEPALGWTLGIKRWRMQFLPYWVLQSGLEVRGTWPPGITGQTDGWEFQTQLWLKRNKGTGKLEAPAARRDQQAAERREHLRWFLENETFFNWICNTWKEESAFYCVVGKGHHCQVPELESIQNCVLGR